jgi:LL-H family phage holin
VAQSVSPLVYQAEKRGGDGEEKLNFVINGIDLLLTMAHLPHPTTSYVKGMVEKAVTAMNQAQSIADTVDKPKTTIVGELKEVKK